MYSYPQAARGILYYKEPSAFSDVLRTLERDKKKRFKAIITEARRWPLTNEIAQITFDVTASKDAWEVLTEALEAFASAANDGYVTAEVQWDEGPERVVFDGKAERPSLTEERSTGKQMRYFPLFEGCVWRYSDRTETPPRDTDWRVCRASRATTLPATLRLVRAPALSTPDRSKKKVLGATTLPATFRLELASHAGAIPHALNLLQPDGPRLYLVTPDPESGSMAADTSAHLILDEEAEPGTVWFRCDRDSSQLWLYFHDGFEAIHAPYGDLPVALTWRIERHQIARTIGEPKQALASMSRLRIALGDRLGPVLIRQTEDGKTTLKLDLARIDPGEGQTLPPAQQIEEDQRPWWKIW